ncbi:MAG: archaellin/type IV pilin N-terminal domain-containing protein [Candidatus Woesearchaeota archaeon]
MIQSKKAEMGMGTLIIFIAMVLVAAVAASVLITTTGSLQGKALDTGMSSKREIGTNIQILSVEYDGTDFLTNIKLSPGSEPIDMADGYHSVAVDGKSPTRKQMSDACDTALSGNVSDEKLNAGDVAQCVIEEDADPSDKVTITLTPLVGTPSNIPVTIPPAGTGSIFP